MASRIDQAWEDMKSPEAAKTRAYASRVKWILNGSKPADPRSEGDFPTGVQPGQCPASSNLSVVEIESKTLESSTSSFSQVRVTYPRESIGEEGQPRTVSTGINH